MVRLDRGLPRDTAYDFAQDLLGRGRSSDAFALFKVLAAGGDGPSAFAVAKMYDPLLWSPAMSPFSQANPRQAVTWYRRALERGVEEARVSLDSLSEWEANREGVGADVR
jgi:TPR repeat protein